MGHMYIYNFFLLGMTDTMRSQNVDLSSWDTVHIYLRSELFNKEITEKFTNREKKLENKTKESGK
jgi:hypothetical protein